MEYEKLMGKIIGKAKAVGKSYYFYCFLYCVGMIGTVAITIYRHEIISDALNFTKWWNGFLLVTVLWSVPILSYKLMVEITRTLAIAVSGVSFVIILIIYGISTTRAELFVNNIKDFLMPFLLFFVFYSGIIIAVKMWQKVKSK